MPRFPTLSSGAVTQYPTARTLDYGTTILQYVGGREQRFASRVLVRRWRVNLVDATEKDVEALERFFEEQQGQFGSFEFTDPYDGTNYPDCSIEADSIETVSIGYSRSSTSLIIRTSRS